MLPIASIIAGGLAFASSAQAAYSYSVAEKYGPSDFLDTNKWKWATSAVDFASSGGDPTNGYVNYVDDATAVDDLKIAGVADDKFFMKLDASQTINSNKINSVRLESRTRYENFLIMGHFSAFPKPECGVWPAFWTNGDGEWPKAGEINMYESWNADDFNRPALHTGTKEEFGSLFLEEADFLDGNSILRNDCDNMFEDNNTGCVVKDTSGPYGSPNGGVFAIQFESDRIRMWSWANGASPVNLDDEHPDVETFGTPNFATPVQPLDTLFKPQQIIINLDVCGGAPEATWDQAYDGKETCAQKTGKATCKEYVESQSGSIFADSTFKIQGMTVWTANGDGGDGNEDTIPTTSEVSAEPTATTTSTPSAEPTTSEEPETTTEEPEPTTAVEETTSSAEPTTVDEPTGTAAPTTDSEEDCDATASSTRKTIYTTTTSTRTSCEPTVTDCPAEATASVEDEVELCTSTIYSTEIEVVTSCEQIATACTPGDTTTRVLVSTTVFPVETASPEAGGDEEPAGEEDAATTTTTSPAQPTDSQNAGEGGDDGSAVAPPPTATTLVQLSSSVVPGCLSGTGCSTGAPGSSQTAEPVVEVSGAGTTKASLAGWVGGMFVAGVLFL